MTRSVSESDPSDLEATLQQLGRPRAVWRSQKFLEDQLAGRSQGKLTLRGAVTLTAILVHCQGMANLQQHLLRFDFWLTPCDHNVTRSHGLAAAGHERDHD